MCTHVYMCLYVALCVYRLSLKITMKIKMDPLIYCAVFGLGGSKVLQRSLSLWMVNPLEIQSDIVLGWMLPPGTKLW